MRKIFMLTALAFVLGAPTAFAEEGSDKKGHHGGHHKGKMFEKADTNGDGTISKDEFSAFHSRVFDKMDVDGDGQITRDEQQKRRDEWKKKAQERRDTQQQRRDEWQDRAQDRRDAQQDRRDEWHDQAKERRDQHRERHHDRQTDSDDE